MKCHGFTKKETQCKKKAQDNGFCSLHQDQYKELVRKREQKQNELEQRIARRPSDHKLIIALKCHTFRTRQLPSESLSNRTRGMPPMSAEIRKFIRARATW